MSLKKQLMDSIEKHEGYISFDIFDTLILRKFAEPFHLFYVVQEKYNIKDHWVSHRMECEQISYGRYPGATTIHNIYDDIMGSYNRYTKEEIALFKQTEIEAEIEYTYANPFMKEMYDYAVSLGKRIVIFTDMYLTEENIVKILHKNGYTQYEKLYVSCDVRVSKSQGTAYPFLCKTLNCKAHEILHIGDNVHADIAMGKKNGVKTFYIPKPLDTALKNNRLFSQIYRHFMHNRYNFSPKQFISYSSFMAFIINKFVEPDNIPNNEEGFSWSYLRYAPAFYGYFAHIVKFGKENNIHNIWFQARDMKYPLKWFQKYLELHNIKDFDPKYVYLNRKMISKLYLKIQDNKDDLFTLSDKGDNLCVTCNLHSTPKDLLKNMEDFGLYPNSNMKNPENKQRFFELCKQYTSSPEYLKEFETVTNYLLSLGADTPTLIVDTGWTGQSHHLYTRFSEDFFKTKPFSMLCWANMSKILRTNSNVFCHPRFNFMDFNINLFFETIFCYHSPSIQTINYDEQSHEYYPVFSENLFDFSIQNQKTVLLHQQILQFFEEYFHWTRNILAIDSEFITTCLNFSLISQDKEDISFIKSYKHEELDVVYPIVIDTQDAGYNLIKRLKAYYQIFMPFSRGRNVAWWKHGSKCLLSPLEKKICFPLVRIAKNNKNILARKVIKLIKKFLSN